MSVWDDIDRLKKRHEHELAKTQTRLFDAYGKREANSLRIEADGRWRVLHDGREYFGITAAALLEKLPAPKKRTG